MKKIFRTICLLMSSCALFACAKNSNIPEGYVSVHFDVRTDLETNVINDQIVKIGSFAKEPSVICPKNLDIKKQISGWYKEKSYKHRWDFSTNPVTKNMTLYAKWADMISITYYLTDLNDPKALDNPIWVVNNASYGEPLERHDELCDGYEFYGYFSDEECTVPFDLEKPLYEDTVVYMYRGQTLHLDANSIKRRFSMEKAGGSGSVAGHISDVKLDPSGLSCVDVNFGYSTTADPYMLITNPQIDISKSQKIKIKFKNFGACTSLAFYWISFYDYEGEKYADGKQNYDEANSAHFALNGYECFMTEDDPWIEREFDLSETFTNGVSTWGNSVKLKNLRIQFGYVSRNPSDTSNVIRIASINAVSDDKNVGFKDSELVKSMLYNDDESEVAEVSKNQTQNKGVIFPKNADTVKSLSTYYVKKDGLLLYSPYGVSENSYTFNVKAQEIDASLFSYLSIRLRNYSYISSIDVYVYTIDANGKTHDNVMTAPLSIRMNKFGSVDLNFYSKANMTGTIHSFEIFFKYNGVDNAILIESMTIKENKSLQIPGFNFSDPKYAGFVSNDDVSLSLNKSLLATTFTTTKATGVILYELDYAFDITPYSTMEFTYCKSKSGIDSLKISIKINNEWKEYPLELGDPSSQAFTVEYDLLDAGVVQALKFEFTNSNAENESEELKAGLLEIKSLEFVLDGETSWDVSDPNTSGKMLSDWAEPITYIEDQRAVFYSHFSNGLRYYFGNQYANGNRDSGNICLENKTTIYLIYKNLNGYGTPFINAYVVDSTKEQDYLKEINERSAFISNHTINIDKNMDERSWKIAKIDIPSDYAKSNFYLSNFFLGSVGNAQLDYYIRGIAIK